MASKRITDLTADTAPASGDFVVTVDISDTTDASDGSNKKVTLSNLATAIVGSTSNVSNGPASASTQTITHSLGRIPVIIRLNAINQGNNSANGETTGQSHGVYDGSGNRCIYMAVGVSSTAPVSSTVFSIRTEDIGTTAVFTGVVGNVGATTFDIVWTLAVGTGSSANARFIWEAQ